MPDDKKRKTIPVNDIPPHPEPQVKNADDRSSQSVNADKDSQVQPQQKTNLEQETISEQAQDKQVFREVQGKAKPKKGFPVKILVFGVIFILVLSVLVFLGIKVQRTGVGGLFGQKGEIVWWGIQENRSVLEPLIREYEEDNPGVEITYIRQSSEDYRVRLANALASGEGPDIFEIHNTWKPMFAQQLSVAPDSVYNKSKFTETFYPVIVSDLMRGNGVIAVPLEYDAITLYINEDIFASAAKIPPETWDEVRELAVELTQRSGAGVVLQSGAALGFSENIDHWQEIVGLMLYQNGANPARPDECVTTSVKARACLATDALSFYQVFAKNRVWDTRLAKSTIAFASGKVAMYFAPARRAYEVNQANSDLKFKTVRLPQLPKDTPLEPDVSYATYWAHGVWEKSTNKDTAWRFLEFLSTAESLEKINFERKQERGFAMPPPRKDMATAYLNDPVLGSVLALAPNAKSWFLAADTHDGEKGINSQVSNLYVQAVGPGVGVKSALNRIGKDIRAALARFGVSPGQPSP